MLLNEKPILIDTKLAMETSLRSAICFQAIKDMIDSGKEEITYNEITEKLPFLTFSTVRSHVRKLEELKYIESKIVGKNKKKYKILSEGESIQK